MKVVSIIIPVYNVEEYIHECVGSVIKQSYRDLEIFLINDGSTDKSGDICKEIANQDNRIIYIEKENGGLSSARNYGLKKATGDFVFFLDSDDYLAPDAIETLIKEQERSNSDIVSSGFEITKNRAEKKAEKKESTFITGDSSLFFLQKISNHACAKLYKKKIFEGIFYPENQHYEDVATTFKLYDKAQKVSYTENGLYCYRIREGAITRTITNQDINDLWKAYNNIKDYFSIPDNIQSFYEMTVLYTIYSRLLRSSCNRKEFTEHEKRIFSELRTFNFKLSYFIGKSAYYPKLLLLKYHLTKPIIKLLSLKCYLQFCRKKSLS